MDAIKNDVLRLTEKELAAANEKFPLFNGKHEAYAVILEESEEAQEEMQNLECLVSDYWKGTKENHAQEDTRKELEAIYNTAVNLAVEAIQTAAMARKAIVSEESLFRTDRSQTQEGAAESGETGKH